MNKLEKLANYANKKMFVCMNVSTTDEFYNAEQLYRIANSKLNKLADKIGKSEWERMLNETNLCSTSYAWVNYRNYMIKQKG